MARTTPSTSGTISVTGRPICSAAGMPVDLGEVVVDAHDAAARGRRARGRRVRVRTPRRASRRPRRPRRPGARCRRRRRSAGRARRRARGRRAELAAGGERQRPELLAARQQRRHELAGAGGPGSSSAIVQRSATAPAAASTARSRASRSPAPASASLAAASTLARAAGRLAAGADQRAAGRQRAERADGEDEQGAVGGLHVVREHARDDRGQQRQRADRRGAAPVGAERGEQRRDPVERDDGDVGRGRQIDHEQQRRAQRCAATAHGRERDAPMAFSTTSYATGGGFRPKSPWPSGG